MATKKSAQKSPQKRTPKQLCSLLPRPKPQLSEAVTADVPRARAILIGRNKWANKTVLHYCFFKGNSRYKVPKKQADAIRNAFAEWKAIGIGLEFEEVNKLSEAEVRIG